MMEKFLIPREIGGELHAEIYRTDLKSTILAILCHGFTGDKYEWGRFVTTAKHLNTAGIDALIFDFSGSGENKREIVHLSRQIRDLEEVYLWGKNQGYQKITTIGLSFGGVTSFLTKLPDRFCAVFWAPALNMGQIMQGRSVFSYQFMKWRLKNLNHIRQIPVGNKHHPPLQIDLQFYTELENLEIDTKLQQFNTPTLILQGEKDNTVKKEWNELNFAKMPQDENHKLILIPYASHCFDGNELDQAIQKTIAWIQKYV